MIGWVLLLHNNMNTYSTHDHDKNKLLLPTTTTMNNRNSNIICSLFGECKNKSYGYLVIMLG